MGEPCGEIAETETEGMRLLEVDVATCFVMSGSQRIERENDPDHSPGPRLFFAGCAGGKLVRIRHDVSDQTAQSILAIAEEEPPGSIPRSNLVA